MPLRMLDRRRFAGLGVGSLLAVLVLTVPLGACAPIMVRVDNPKDADPIAISVGQPLRIRWTSHGDPGWNLQVQPMKVLKYVADGGKAPDAGSLELKVFDFVGATPGVERLTFIYGLKGNAKAGDDMVTVVVTVK